MKSRAVGFCKRWLILVTISVSSLKRAILCSCIIKRSSSGYSAFMYTEGIDACKSTRAHSSNEITLSSLFLMLISRQTRTSFLSNLCQYFSRYLSLCSLSICFYCLRLPATILPFGCKGACSKELAISHARYMFIY
jgi:hypothetical protein